MMLATIARTRQGCDLGLHAWRYAPRSFSTCHISRRSKSAGHDQPSSALDEEPLNTYKPGGYHPVRLGDRVSDGRYKIIHKLGWGAFSTIWAARDHKHDRNVALKILQAAVKPDHDREMQTFRFLNDKANEGQRHDGAQHVVNLHDHFELRGANGSHDCLVLDLTGPSLQDYIERRGRPLGLEQAKSVGRQMLQALDYLHSLGVGHGDVHLRNLVLALPELASMSEQDLTSALGEPVTEDVPSATDQEGGDHVPSYRVQSSTFPNLRSAAADADDDDDDDSDAGATATIKLLDFGASFRGQLEPRKLLNPAVVRPPEAIFGDGIDYRADLWSAGCTIFELMAGKPLFTVQGTTGSATQVVAAEQLSMVDDELPERWAAQRDALARTSTGAQSRDGPAHGLDGRLDQILADDDGRGQISDAEITAVKDVVKRLLRFEPGHRIEARDALGHEFFSS